MVSVKRLSDETHALGRRVLEGQWGASMVDAPIALDGVPGLDCMPTPLQAAHAVRLISEQAPLRIDPAQRLVGGATLLASARHRIPVYLDGQLPFVSVSHLTAGFDHLLKVGYRGLRAQIDERIARGDLDSLGQASLAAMSICIDAAGIWHERHMAELAFRIALSSDQERQHYVALRDTLANVPEGPPTTFREALQSLWFAFAFQRLCGNWPGIGRIDEMLGDFLRRDLQTGRITLDDARELMAHFFINGCEWIGPTPGPIIGNGENYQNIILAGIDADGREVANEVTDIVLDVVEELQISVFPIAVRISPRTSDSLLRHVAQVQRLGQGIVAVYNEDVVIRAMTRFGYQEAEARRFVNDGCWEVQIPGETAFGYEPFDTLYLLQEAMGIPGEGPIPDFDDFEQVYSAFERRLAQRVGGFHDHANGAYLWEHDPTPLISLLVKDCIGNARCYYSRGPRYNVLSPHAGGIPDTGNSLLALKQLVFDERRLSYSQFIEILRNNWEGAEDLRRQVLAKFVAYGNDDPEADAMTKRVFDSFLTEVERVPERNGVKRPAGVSSFGREIMFRENRTATPDGHVRGDLLATNFSPTPGTDHLGPTAVVRSFCAMGLDRLPCGTALELKMDPTSVAGEEGVDALAALMRSFVELGGFFMQIDVVSNDVLREAQKHPEQYSQLAVRVSGWSARFVLLGAQWQEMIINRSVQV